MSNKPEPDTAKKLPPERDADRDRVGLFAIACSAVVIIAALIYRLVSA